MVSTYIDEYGTPDVNDKEKIFSYTSVLIKNENYNDIYFEISKLKERLSYEYKIPDDFELHIKTLLGNKKKKDNLGKLGHLSYLERREIYKQIFDVIEHLDFKTITIAIVKDDHAKVIDNEERLSIEKDYRFKVNLYLIERIQMFTEELANNRIATLYMDETNASWDKIRANIVKNAIYSRSHPSYIKIDNILAEVFFLDSSQYIGLQIADSMTYCIGRWLRCTLLEKEGEIDKINNKCFEKIKEKIHKYPDAMQKGLKIYPNEWIEKVRENLL